MRPLEPALSQTGLPRAAVETVAVWAQFIGQRVSEAPSPMAFAPALLHRFGAYQIVGGIGGEQRGVGCDSPQAIFAEFYGGEGAGSDVEHGKNLVVSGEKCFLIFLEIARRKLEKCFAIPNWRGRSNRLRSTAAKRSNAAS